MQRREENLNETICTDEDIISLFIRRCLERKQNRAMDKAYGSVSKLKYVTL